MDTVKSIIRDNRLKLNITRAELAEKIGVNPSTITRWESGEVANMTRRNMIKLANALQISPIDLLGITDDPFSNDEKKLVNSEYSQNKKITCCNQNISDDALNYDKLIKKMPDIKEVVALYSCLDAFDRGGILGEIKGLLKSDKYKPKVQDEII